MTVAELIKALSQCDFNAEVKFFDTFWDSEGWGPLANESRWNEIIDVFEDNGEVFIRQKGELR